MIEAESKPTTDLALRLQMAERRIEDLYDRVRRLETELRTAGARAALVSHTLQKRR